VSDTDPRTVDALELRLARLELSLLEVVTAVGMLVGELALRDDLVLKTPSVVERALEHGWQALVGVPDQASGGIVVDSGLADPAALAEAAPAAVAAAVHDTGAAVGAFYAVVGDQVRLLASVGYPAGVMDAFAEFPVTAALPAATAVREQRPLWFDTREEIVDTYPHLRDAHEETEAELGDRGVRGAVVPLVAAGSIVAVVIIGFTAATTGPSSTLLDGVRLRLAASLRR
jgi:hypothetical protein